MRLLYRPVYAPGFGQILVSKSRTRDRRGPSHAGDDTDKLKPALHTALATAVFTQPRSRALCNDLKKLFEGADDPDSALDTFVECVTNPESDFEGEAGELGIDVSSAGHARVRSQLLALRGLLGCDLLTHCLALRHRVQYGINGKCASSTANCHMSQLPD